MEPLTSQTLAQIVTTNHRAAAVFEKYHLDFCCKGKRSLQQACDEKHLPADELVRELETVAAGANTSRFPYEALSLEKLAVHIVDTYHKQTRDDLPQLFAWAEKVAAKHGERHPELYRIFELVAALKEEMDLHMQKEEKILFPRITEIEKLAAQPAILHQQTPAYIQGPVNVMEHEHDHAGDMMKEIRELTADYTPPADACTTYKLLFASLQAFEIMLHQHVHLENNILFPAAVKLFDAGQQLN